MLTCCRRDTQFRKPLLEPESEGKKSSWRGRLVEFYCKRGKNNCDSMFYNSALVIIATIVSSAFLADSLLKPPTNSDSPSPTPIISGIVLVAALGVNLFSECDTAVKGYKHPRKVISPTLSITIALTISCAILLILRNTADNGMMKYDENQQWADQRNQEIQDHCMKFVLANGQNLTSDNCVLCEPLEETVSVGPYQSHLRHGLGYVFITDCPWPKDGRNITISANASYPGRNYLCGLPDVTDTTTTTLDREMAQCVIDYVEKAWCLYPPLVLKGIQVKNSYGIYYTFKGFATFRVPLELQCAPDINNENACIFASPCNTPEAKTYYTAVTAQYAEVQNKTLSFPYEDNQTLSRTDPVVVPLLGTTGGFVGFSVLYEAFAARMYLRAHEIV